jgi:hypothetical protein
LPTFNIDDISANNRITMVTFRVSLEITDSKTVVKTMSFPGKSEITVQDLLAASREEFKRPNLWVCNTQQFCTFEPLVNLDERCHENLLIVPEDGDDDLQVVKFQKQILSSSEAQNVLRLKFNKYHARTGVKLKALPPITAVESFDGKRLLSAKNKTPTTTGEIEARVRKEFKSAGSFILYSASDFIKSANPSLSLHEIGMAGPVVRTKLLSPVITEIFIKTYTGKTISISCYPEMTTTEELKRLLQDAKGVPPDQQRLIYVGKKMEDGQLLSSYGINSGSIVHFALFLRGNGRCSRRVIKEENKRQLTMVKLLLPDGKEEILEINPSKAVLCLLKQHIASVIASKESSDDDDDDNESTEDDLEVVDSRIKRLREELLDSELKKERLVRRRKVEHEQQLTASYLEAPRGKSYCIASSRGRHEKIA